jgi:hypothetical protein
MAGRKAEAAEAAAAGEHLHESKPPQGGMFSRYTRSRHLEISSGMQNSSSNGRVVNFASTPGRRADKAPYTSAVDPSG